MKNRFPGADPDSILGGINRLGDLVAEAEKLHGKPLSLRTGRRPLGECKTCDETPLGAMMPRHEASDYCESGKRPHCSCDWCF